MIPGPVQHCMWGTTHTPVPHVGIYSQGCTYVCDVDITPSRNTFMHHLHRSVGMGGSHLAAAQAARRSGGEHACIMLASSMHAEGAVVAAASVARSKLPALPAPTPRPPPPPPVLLRSPPPALRKLDAAVSGRAPTCAEQEAGRPGASMAQAAWRTALQKSLDANQHLKYSKFMQLATTRPDGRPAVRTVVYRGFLEGTDTLTFNTHFQ